MPPTLGNIIRTKTRSRLRIASAGAGRNIQNGCKLALGCAMVDAGNSEGAKASASQTSLVHLSELKSVICDLENAIVRLDALHLSAAAARVSHGLEIAKDALNSVRSGPDVEKNGGNDLA